MSNVIDLNSIKAKKNEEENKVQFETHLKNVNITKNAVAMLLGELDIPLLDGAIALKVLVEAVIKDSEWDSEEFNSYANTFSLDSSEEKH